MRGYCTVEQVVRHLGKALSGDQELLAIDLIATAESYIDLLTRQGGWLLDPLVDERYELRNVANAISLRSAPVAAVQRVLVRTHQVGDPGQVLTAGTDYELQDARAGLLVFAASYGTAAGYTDYAGSAGFNEAGRLIGSGWSLYSYCLVSYMPDKPVPADIARCAVLLSAHWLVHALNPDWLGLASFSINMHKYTFSEAIAKDLIPPEAAAIIQHRRTLIF